MMEATKVAYLTKNWVNILYKYMQHDEPWLFVVEIGLLGPGGRGSPLSSPSIHTADLAICAIPACEWICIPMWTINIQ